MRAKHGRHGSTAAKRQPRPQPRATTKARRAATGDAVAERMARRRGNANDGTQGSGDSRRAQPRPGERITTDELEAAIAERLASRDAPSLRQIAAEFAVNRSVVERVRDSGRSAARLSVLSSARASRDADDQLQPLGDTANDNGNDVTASDAQRLRANAAGAALRAVPLKMRIRVLKAAVRGPDVRLALAALAMLNELSGIGGKDRDIVPVDTRPLFAVPQRGAMVPDDPASRDASGTQLQLPVDIAVNDK